MCPPTPTAYEHLLYLVREVERVIERGGIDWSSDETDNIRRRLAAIMVKIPRRTDKHASDD